MKFRPSRGMLGGGVARRLAILTTVGCGVLAVGAPVAGAHSAHITFNACSSVTFAYSDFGANNLVTAHETLTDGSTVVASKTFTFTPPVSNDTHSDTVTYTGVKNGDTLVAKTVYSGASGSGTITASAKPPGCPLNLTYTGDAYNVGVSANLLGIVTLPPLFINTVGPVSTMSSSNASHTILSESYAPLALSGAQLVSSVVTGSNTSTASTSVNGLSVLQLPQGAPVVNTSEIQSSSQTSCAASTATLSSTGSTSIAYLAIGGTVVVGPGGAVPSGPIPANTTIPLGPLGSVVLNEQTPITGGLSVNAIDIKLLTNLGLGTVNVIIGHAESDVEGC